MSDVTNSGNIDPVASAVATAVAQLQNTVPAVTPPSSPNTMHPDLVNHAQAMVDYLALEVAKYNELVAHVENLRGQLEAVSDALSTNVKKDVVDTVVVVQNEVKDIKSKVQNTVQEVKKDYLSVIFNWLFHHKKK